MFEDHEIDPDAASPDAMLEVADNYPSGAIRIERSDGGETETAPKVNLISVRENGPLAFHAELKIGHQPVSYRATLCRCGQSKNKPFCDGTHAAIGIVATGEPPPADSTPLAHRVGSLTVTQMPNGPLTVAGSVEIVSGNGNPICPVPMRRLPEQAFLRWGARPCQVRGALNFCRARSLR
jgi:CDGSH-type Zn-finger protein